MLKGGVRRAFEQVFEGGVLSDLCRASFARDWCWLQ